MTLAPEAVADAVAYIDDWVGYRQRTLRVPGVQIAVRSGTDLVLSKAYGSADVERDVPLTTDHVFRIASHSKTFTATSVLQLVEQGRVRLDEPVGSSGATVGHLLAHGSGMTRDGEVADFWQLTRPFLAGGELVDLPVLEPSEQFKYSNIGYSLLGSVVEKASGQSYVDYVTEHIIQPLGLRQTTPELTDEAAMATGYSSRRYGLDRVPLPHVTTGDMAAATGFCSTAEDLCRYGAAHFLGSGELLTDLSKRDMQRPHWEVENDGSHYGLGLAVRKVDDRRVVGHGGGFPGFITYTLIDPKDQLVVVALTNAIDGPALELVTGMLRIINRSVKATRTAGTDHRRFAGRFFSIWSALDVAVFGDEVLALAPDAPDPMAEVTELEPDEDNALEITKSNGYSSPGERVRYEPDGTILFAGQRMSPWGTFINDVMPRFSRK